MSINTNLFIDKVVYPFYVFVVLESLTIHPIPVAIPSQFPNPLDLIHAQGLQVPQLAFQVLKDTEDPLARPYFNMPIDIDHEYPITNLCCRKKSNDNKFRFVYATCFF